MQTLGKYQLIAEIARGGMGIVYLAVASGPAGFSKLFVIKELKPELVDDSGFFDMFLEEARLAARLSHPNIVTTYEVGVDGRRPFIVMDYLDGESLGRVIRKRSPKFTVAMHLRLLCHALDGLDYAHHLTNFDDTTACVVHRDMSPQNVFVTFDGQVKIVDFGIAKASDTSIETQAGIFKGKPGYMAPEQLSGDVDPRADLFSVGVMIWEAVAGRRMWPKKGQIEILTALIKGDIPRLDEVSPGAPAELKRICDKATAKEPDDRYATASEMRNDLEAYLESQNERMTVREISQVIAALFEEQRKQMRAVMEKCIAEAKEGVPPSKLPSLAPPPLETTTPRPIEHTLSMTTRSVSANVPAAASRSSISVVDSNVSVVETMSGTPVSQATPDGSALTVAHQAEQAQKTKHHNRLLLLLAIALIVASALATALVIRSNDGPRTGSPAAAAAPPPSPFSPPRSPTPAQAAAAPATAVAAATATEAPAPAEQASAAAAASARALAAAAAAAQPKTRIVYVPAPPPRAPAPTPPAAAPAAPPEKPATSKADCNPPFFFEGTKKVFKPGCL